MGDTFLNLRVGNSYQVRATRLILPGGVKGWSGRARIMAMTYNESRNTVGMTLVGRA